MSTYRNRTLFRDNVTSIWWEISALFAVVGWVLVGLGQYGWLALALPTALAAWQIGRAGVWMGNDDILAVTRWKRSLRRALSAA